MNESPHAVRVVVVEDHELLAESLRLALTAEGMSVTVAASLAMDEILALATNDCPDVVLLDLDLGTEGVDGSLLVEPLTLIGVKVVVVVRRATGPGSPRASKAELSGI